MYKIGSKKDVKKAPKESMDKVTETFETFIALKKNIQWIEIKKPQKNNFIKSENEILISFFKITIKVNNANEAVSILYHTSWKELIEINDPKIAVNPKTNTMKWKCSKLLVLLPSIP